MSHTPHELVEEFPDAVERIHALKETDGHFARLAEDYHEVNRQIHRMGDAIGHRVMRLSRQSFAGISIDRLKPGDYRELKRDELQQLKKKFLNPYRRAREASKGE